jgi:hypothetical protein
MNAIIKKLLDQASVFDAATGYFVRVDQEKFAALIVRKCADAADMAEDCQYPGDYVGEQMGYGEEDGITTWRSNPI